MMVNKVIFALISAIRDLAHLLTIIVNPPPVVILVVKVKDIRPMDEIDKGVAHVAVVI